MKQGIPASSFLLALVSLGLGGTNCFPAQDLHPDIAGTQRIAFHAPIVLERYRGNARPTGSGRTLIRIHPLDPDHDMDRVRRAVKNSSYEQALQILQPYLRAPLEYPRFYSDYLVLLAWTGKAREAVASFSRLPARFPRRIYLLNTMAHAYRTLGRYPDSCALYRESLAMDRNNGQAFHGLITCLLLQDDVSGAARAWKEFLPARNKGLLHRLASARLWLRQGHYLKALTTYQDLYRDNVESRYRVAAQREEDIRGLNPAQRAELIRILGNHAALDDQDGNQLLPALLLTLILDGQYQQAVSVYRDNSLVLEQAEKWLVYWLGWAHFKTDRTAAAKTFFNQLLLDPHYGRSSFIGLAYCSAREGDTAGAMAILDRLSPDDIPVLFARAYVRERQSRFWDAIQFYDRILDREDNRLARRLRILALGSLGCTTPARKQAEEHFAEDRSLRLSLLGDQAMNSIRWQEPRQAWLLLQQLLTEHDLPRLRHDSIIALVEQDRMKEAISLFRETDSGKRQPIPYWVRDKIAKAFLYTEQPQEALELYNTVLQEQPWFFNARMGRLYTLLELRRWQEADVVLQRLEHDTPAFLKRHGKRIPNPERMEVLLARGWWYAYQDRLADAERYLTSLLTRAPANIELRNILAHVYLWRGWPRKAMEEFSILHTLDPDYLAMQTGRLRALNETGRKELARNLSGQLLTEHPKNKHLQRLVRELQVEDMRELVVDASFYDEEADASDLRLQTTLYQPLSPWTRLYGQWLWNEVRDEQLLDDFNRVGAGIEHRFSATWKGIQQFSTDLDGGPGPSSLTRIVFTPDDHWSLDCFYDTATLDIPAQARVRDIGADSLSLSVRYRLDESSSVFLQFLHADFDDSNRRNQWLLGLEGGLFVGNDWKAGLGIDLYSSSNTREDAPYFNPLRDYSASLTFTAEQTVNRIYETSFVHRLSLTGGLYAQEGYPVEPLWAVRYEQEHDFSDVHALLIGGTWSNRAYDGNDTNSLTIDLTYRYRF